MLKLIDRNLSSTKKGHSYWKYGVYTSVINKHIEWITESIENSKDGNIRIRVNDITREMGPNFSERHYTSIFTGLRYALFKEGIVIDIGKHIDGDDIFIMRFANHEDGPSVDSIKHIKGCYYWKFSTKRNKFIDFFFCIGHNENRAGVECVYIVPNENIITDNMFINKNWDDHENPYYWFKEDPKPWNDIFHTLRLEDCPVLKTRS